MERKVRVVSAPQEGFIALAIPKELLPELVQESPHPEAAGVLVRIRSAEGFRHLMVDLLDAAATVWPEIAAEKRAVHQETEH